MTKTRKDKGAKCKPDLYAHYVNTCDNPVDKRTWSKTLDALNIEAMRLIIEEGKTLKLPIINKMGVIKYKAYKNNVFDYNHFNKTGEKRFLTNEHSDGYKARIKWYRSLCRLTGKAAYSFEPARNNSRNLAKEMKQFNGHTKYLEQYGFSRRKFKISSKPNNI